MELSATRGRRYCGKLHKYAMPRKTNLAAGIALASAATRGYVVSTVLAQDHFYSVPLSLQMTILFHKYPWRWRIHCAVREGSRVQAPGLMNCAAQCFWMASFTMVFLSHVARSASALSWAFSPRILILEPRRPTKNHPRLDNSRARSTWQPRSTKPPVFKKIVFWARAAAHR